MSQAKRPKGGYFPGDWVRPRVNPGGWTPMIDTQEVHTGNRGVNRAGDYGMYDVPLGVRWQIEEARKSESLMSEPGHGIKPMRAWQGDDGSYHMIYDTPGGTRHAQSRDAFAWEVPAGGEGLLNRHGGDVFKSVFEDPSAPPEQRFKGMGCDSGWYDAETGERMDAGGEGGATNEAVRRWEAQEYEGPAYTGPRVELTGVATGWTSPDRIHWTQLPEPVAPFPMDGGLSGGYDERSGHYFAYCRVHGVEMESGTAPAIGSGSAEVGLVRRAIGLTRTRDFSSWPAPKLVLAPDGQDDLDISFYGADYFPYPGREDLHCMLVQVYHQASDHVDSQLAVSRDGLFWQRPERRAIIPVGPPGSRDVGMVYSWGSGMIALPDGSWGSLYGGMSWLHNAGAPEDGVGDIRWATWQPHRLVGVEAPLVGRFTVPTIYRTAGELRLNYRCKPGGAVRIELLYAVPSRIHSDVDPVAGRTFVECEPLTGDSIDEVVRWKSGTDISAVGEMIGIRVELTRATLFAYSV